MDALFRALSSAQYFPQAHGNLVQLWERNLRAYNQLANDAGEPIGHNRHLSMAMEGLALRFEKVLMMVYEGQGGDDFNAGVEDVVADLVGSGVYHSGFLPASGFLPSLCVGYFQVTKCVRVCLV